VEVFRLLISTTVDESPGAVEVLGMVVSLRRVEADDVRQPGIEEAGSRPAAAESRSAVADSTRGVIGSQRPLSGL